MIEAREPTGRALLELAYAPSEPSPRALAAWLVGRALAGFVVIALILVAELEFGAGEFAFSSTVFALLGAFLVGGSVVSGVLARRGVSRRVIGFPLVMMDLFAIAVIVVAPLFPLLVGHEFEGSVEIVRWLSPIVLLRGLGLYSLNALLGLGRTGIRTGIVVANAAIGVVLFIVLIPGRGWEGAAIATLVTEAMQVLMTWSALVVLQARADRALDASEGERHGTSAVP